jgi:hypothetical protein
VRGYPKLLEDHTGQLNDLLNTLRLIEEEKELQTASVVEQLAKVLEISQELQDFLGKLATWQTTSAARQYVHAIGSAKRDEKEMVGILDRLDRAQNELVTRILLAQVGLTGTLRDGFAAVLPTIQRTDQNVKRVLDARLSIAAQLEGRQSAERGVHISHHSIKRLTFRPQTGRCH